MKIANNTQWSADGFSEPVPSDIVDALQLAERLHARQATLLPNQAAVAHVLVEQETWKEFGFANAQDFCRERLDRSGRWLRNLASLTAPLRRWTAFRRAAAGLDGMRPLGRVAAYEVARVATSANVEHWISRARALPIRALKQEIAYAAGSTGNLAAVQVSGPLPCVAQLAGQLADQTSHVEVPAPLFVAEAMGGLEEVYRASNVAGTQAEYVDGLVAEFRTSLPLSTNVTATDHVSSHGCNTADARAVDFVDAPAKVDARGAKVGAGDRRGGCVGGSPGDSRSVGNLEASEKAIQLARWTLHRTDSVGHSENNTGYNARGCTAGLPGDDARCTSRVAFRQLHALLELENEIELRIAQLLLFIEKRGAWPALGYKHVVEFGVVSMHQSASTTRARLRVVRAMEISPALNKACESGFTHQRALRLVALIRPDKSNESFVKAWIDHARQITIKRLDDELREFDKASGKLHGGTRAPGTWPAPLSDQAWFESIRRAPGDARAFLAKRSFAALASPVAADVFLRLNLPADTATELRMCMREAQRHLETVGALHCHQRRKYGCGHRSGWRCGTSTTGSDYQPGLGCWPCSRNSPSSGTIHS